MYAKLEDTDAVELARENESAGRRQRLPATVLSELYVSVGAGDDPSRNVQKYEQLVGNLPTVGIDDDHFESVDGLEVNTW